MMSCESARRWLDDDVSGELDGPLASELGSHLESCPECREEARRLRGMLALAAALPREIEPERDLWPAIAARLGSEGHAVPAPRRRLVGWAGLAAAAVLLVALSAAITARLMRSALDTQAVRHVVSEIQPAVASNPDLEQAAAEYERAAASLRAALADRRARLAPATLRVVEDNLAIIDAALADLREALRAHPDNPELSVLLASTYRRQLDLLATANQLASI